MKPAAFRCSSTPRPKMAAAIMKTPIPASTSFGCRQVSEETQFHHVLPGGAYRNGRPETVTAVTQSDPAVWQARRWMAVVSDETPVEDILVTVRELWQDGPPHELFKRLRNECPVHWTESITEYPEEAGYWSVTTARRPADGEPRLRDLLVGARRGDDRRRHGRAARAAARRCSSRWTRPSTTGTSTLFQRGFTPKRIAEHEDRIRDDRRRACSTGSRAARPATSSPTSPSRRSRG